MQEKVTNNRLDAPYYVKGLALGLCAYLIGVHFWTWFFYASDFLGGRADFRQLYTAGYMVRTGAGSQLYDYAAQLRFQNLHVSRADLALPYIRPAYAALLFAPLSRLSYRAAYFTFLAINVSLLVLCWALLRTRLSRLSAIYRWLPPALFLAFLPIAAALIQGQDSILLLTLLVGASLALQRRRDTVAGFLVGLGIFKLQIVIPIAGLFLLWRRWRFSIGFFLSAAITGMLSIAVVGWRSAWSYVQSLFAANLTRSFPQPSHSNSLDPKLMPGPEIMPNLHGLVDSVLTGHAPSSWCLGIILAASVALFALIAIRGSRIQGADSLYLAITTSVLVSYYLLIHDVSVMLLPILVFLDRFVGAEESGDSRGRVIVRAAALAFVAPVTMSFAPEHFYLVCLPVLALLTAQMFAYRQPRSFERSDSILLPSPQTSHAH